MERVNFIFWLAGLIIVGLACAGLGWFEKRRARRQARALSLVGRILLIGGAELGAISTSLLAGALSQSMVLMLYSLLGIGLLSLLYVQIQRYRDAGLGPSMKNYSWFTAQGAILTSMAATVLLFSNDHIKQYVLQTNLSYMDAYLSSYALILVIVALIHSGVALLLWEMQQRRREKGEF